MSPLIDGSAKRLPTSYDVRIRFLSRAEGSDDKYKRATLEAVVASAEALRTGRRRRVTLALPVRRAPRDDGAAADDVRPEIARARRATALLTMLHNNPPADRTQIDNEVRERIATVETIETVKGRHRLDTRCRQRA